MMTSFVGDVESKFSQLVEIRNFKNVFLFKINLGTPNLIENCEI